jgi:hypothetical protein
VGYASGRLLGGAAFVATVITSRSARAVGDPVEVEAVAWVTGASLASTLTGSGTHGAGYYQGPRLWVDLLWPSLWYRPALDLRIGSEGGAVAGLLSVDLALGAPLARRGHGVLLLGGGFLADARRSRHLGATVIEPYALAAYRFTGSWFFVLIEARAGLVAAGEYAPDIGLSRSLAPSLDVGGEATFALRRRRLPLFLKARWASIFASRFTARVDAAVASACAAVVCADLAVYRGDVTSTSGLASRAGATVGGLSLLLPIQMLPVISHPHVGGLDSDHEHVR